MPLTRRRAALATPSSPTLLSAARARTGCPAPPPFRCPNVAPSPAYGTPNPRPPRFCPRPGERRTGWSSVGPGVPIPPSRGRRNPAPPIFRPLKFQPPPHTPRREPRRVGAIALPDASAADAGERGPTRTLPPRRTGLCRVQWVRGGAEPRRRAATGNASATCPSEEGPFHGQPPPMSVRSRVDPNAAPAPRTRPWGLPRRARPAPRSASGSKPSEIMSPRIEPHPPADHRRSKGASRATSPQPI